MRLLSTTYWIYQTKRFSSLTPTIFALSSGQGKCGVAVIRVSGPNTSQALLKMTTLTQLPKPRMATLQHVRDPETLEELDKGLLLWFPGPKSFTGEDSCEFQIHGGPAVVAAVLSALSKLPNFRPAEAGEFTKRAFFSGKLDLTEVEGLGDLIHAETELQRKQALYQMEGNLSVLYKQWRADLVKCLAHTEAYIDFSEDDNIEEGVLEEVNIILNKLQKEIENHLTDGRKGERLRDGIRTTIIGQPNAGKSSLLNALCQKPAAIVTPIPGTTRDVIQMNINIEGFPVILNDTAGLRANTSDIVEKEGILRAHSTVEKADLVLLVVDVTIFFKSHSSFSPENIKNFIQSHMKDLNLSIKYMLNENETDLPQCICVFNKIDKLSEEQKTDLQNAINEYSNINCISCETEEGFLTFMKNLTCKFQKLCGNPSRENPSLTQSRHRFHLNECLKFLNEYFEVKNTDVTLAAQKLRLSARHLGKIMGAINSEEILDVIFRDFCIGK